MIQSAFHHSEWRKKVISGRNLSKAEIYYTYPGLIPRHSHCLSNSHSLPPVLSVKIYLQEGKGCEHI